MKKKFFKVICLTDKYRNFSKGQDVTEGFRYIQDIKPRLIEQKRRLISSLVIKKDKEDIINTKNTKDFVYFHYISIQNPKTKNVQLYSLENFKIIYE